MMEGRDEGDGEGSEGEDEGSEAKEGVKCSARAGCSKVEGFSDRTLGMNTEFARIRL